jgi:predicted amidophosphoribosyltransferase
MKTCPFCKNDVPNDTVTCPFCSRTLIEKVGMQRKNEAKPRNTSTYKEKTVHYETYTEPKSQPQKEIKKSNKKYYPLIVLCIFVGLIVYDSLQPVETVSVVPSQSFPTQEVYQEAVISPNDNSLQN